MVVSYYVMVSLILHRVSNRRLVTLPDFIMIIFLSRLNISCKSHLPIYRNYEVFKYATNCLVNIIWQNIREKRTNQDLEHLPTQFSHFTIITACLCIQYSVEITEALHTYHCVYVCYQISQTPELRKLFLATLVLQFV